MTYILPILFYGCETWTVTKTLEPDRQWRSSSFQESKKVRVSRHLWPWPWPWAYPGCTLTRRPSCASLVAIRPFAWEKKRFAQKFTDRRTDRRRTPRHCISSFLEWAKNDSMPLTPGVWTLRKTFTNSIHQAQWHTTKTTNESVQTSPGACQFLIEWSPSAPGLRFIGHNEMKIHEEETRPFYDTKSLSTRPLINDVTGFFNGVIQIAVFMNLY